MQQYQAPKPFPIQHTPTVIRAAAFEMERLLCIPFGMAIAILLSALSMAGQALINVKRLNGLIGPASLWFLIVTISGGRKSASEECAFKPIREFEIEQAARYQQALDKYEIESKTWSIKERALLKAIAAAAEEGEDTHDLETRLIELAKNKPRKPRQLRFIFNDISSAGIKARLHDSTPSMGIATDEGAALFRGNALVDVSLPNRLWSGGTLQVDRANGLSFTVHDPRLTLSIQTHPGPLRRYLLGKGEQAREEGFWNRMLVCFPEIPFGWRFIGNEDYSWKDLAVFQRRIRELLEMNLTPDDSPPTKTTLSFSPAAQARWIVAYNNIESMLGPGGYYSMVPDYAAKIADNIARTAGLYHLFEGHEGDISLETLEYAIGTVSWFTEEFMRVLAPRPQPPQLPQIPQDQLDAHALEVWFAQYFRLLPAIRPLSRNYVLQHGPNMLRRATRLGLALERLALEGKVMQYVERKKCYITLSPNYFTRQQIEFLCNQAARIA